MTDLPPNKGIAEYEAKRAREQTWYAGHPLTAFDEASRRLLVLDSKMGVAESLVILRVYFLDELARLDPPRSQARPA